MAVATPPESAGSVPPHNEEAEASVLGAILLTEQALDGVLLEAGLRPDHFYRPRHQLVFRAMIRLKEKAEPEAVDALTVCDDLRSHGELEAAGSEAYVHSLPTVVPAVGAVLDYARIVRDDALMRGILDTTRRIQAEVLAHRGDPRDLIERAEAELFKIGHEGGLAEMRSIEDVLHEEIDKLEELSRKGVGLTGTPSGFTDIDELTGGFQPGNLIVLAARPSMGKSTLATNIVENAAIDHGRPAALFSLEMSETELAHRFIASQAKVSSDELRKGRVKADRWPKVLRAVEKLARAPIFIDDSSDIGVLEMRAKARRLHAKHGLGLIVVDYLQLLRPDARADSRVEAPPPADPDALRPPRERPGRAGRRRRHVRLPRGVLRQGVRAARRGGHHPGQAPQRADRGGQPHLPVQVSALREPLPRACRGDDPRRGRGALRCCARCRRTSRPPAPTASATAPPGCSTRRPTSPAPAAAATSASGGPPAAASARGSGGAFSRCHSSASRSSRSTAPSFARCGPSRAQWKRTSRPAADSGSTGRWAPARRRSPSWWRRRPRTRGAPTPSSPCRACSPRSSAPSTATQSTPTWASSAASAPSTCSCSTTSARRSRPNGCSSSSIRSSTSAGRTGARSSSRPTSRTPIPTAPA